MNLAAYDISNPHKALVKSSERITPEGAPEVRHIVLEVPDANMVFLEGQSIGVLVPGPHAFGNENHVRLYSIASARNGEMGRSPTIAIAVRRCSYIDEVSGEEFPGVASNYLCSRKPGDFVSISGPYGSHFAIPDDPTSNLLMIGVGTGIAPFRAFLKHIYEERSGWQGKVRLFYGAQTGMELLYMNDRNNDLANYYDEKTFKAIEAVSPRPHFDEPAAIDSALEEHAADVWDLLQDSKTRVYVAGLEKMTEKMDKALSRIAGSEAQWFALKVRLRAENRWAELLY